MKATNMTLGCDCERCKEYHQTQVKNVIRLKDRDIKVK